MKLYVKGAGVESPRHLAELNAGACTKTVAFTGHHAALDYPQAEVIFTAVELATGGHSKSLQRGTTSSKLTRVWRKKYRVFLRVKNLRDGLALVPLVNEALGGHGEKT